MKTRKYQKLTGWCFYKSVPNPSTKPIMVGNIDLHLANGFLKIIFSLYGFFISQNSGFRLGTNQSALMTSSKISEATE